MPIKILHTSDVHLGAKFLFLGDKAQIQRDQIKKTFQITVDLAIEKGVNLFFISGDLFDSPFPSAANVLFVKDQLFRLADNNIRVAVIPGNHDRIESGCVWTVQDISEGDPNIFIFDNKSKKEWVLRDIDLTVYGNVNSEKKSNVSPLSQIAKTNKTKLHAALVHGSVTFASPNQQTNFPITEEDISKSGMNYIALGDWHGVLDVSRGGVSAWYSGSPEMVSSDQLKSGYVLYAEIDEQGTKVEPLRVGERQFDMLEIDLTSIENLDQLVRRLTEGADKNLVRSIVLKGVRNLGMQIDLEEITKIITSKYFHVRIKDVSNLRISEEDLKSYSDQFIIGKFISVMNEIREKAENKDVVDEAIQLGVNLLKDKKA